MTHPLVITVDFRLNPGATEEFVALVTENARLSLQNEPGCKRFDVVLPAGTDNQVFLYEIYTDDAAFDDHCKSDHFKSFDQASAALVASRTIVRARLVN